jgi:UDP:flavonoid glycosyltransferase YjiC (YdhE family)
MDNARDGAVLFSFGSITDTTQMSVQMRRAILRAFARFPSVQFLWKLDSLSAQNDSALFSAVPNVHTFQWIQQTAVLSKQDIHELPY